jgi:hypothetical protein
MGAGRRNEREGQRRQRERREGRERERRREERRERGEETERRGEGKREKREREQPIPGHVLLKHKAETLTSSIPVSTR